MSRITTALLASLLVVALATAAWAASSYGPPFKQGPTAGDESTFVQTDPATGLVMIAQHNTRQAATVHCIGEGPQGTLLAEHVVSEPVSRVEVAYAEALMTEHPVIDVAVTGSSSGLLGHAVSHGPKILESGTIAVPLYQAPALGETLTIQMGLQVHAGCLPHPFVLGLPGSRPVEGGRVTFSSVTVS